MRKPIDYSSVEYRMKRLTSDLKELRAVGVPADFDVHISYEGAVTIRSHHWDRIPSFNQMIKKARSEYK